MQKKELKQKRDYLITNLMTLNGKINSMFPFDPPKLNEAAEELEKQIKKLNVKIKQLEA